MLVSIIIIKLINNLIFILLFLFSLLLCFKIENLCFKIENLFGAQFGEFENVYKITQETMAAFNRENSFSKRFTLIGLYF